MAPERSGCQRGGVAAFSWVADGCLLFISSHSREVTGEPSGIPFKRALIAIVRALSSGLNHHPNASPPNTITLEISVSTDEFGGTQTFSHIRTPEDQTIKGASFARGFGATGNSYS